MSAVSPKLESPRYSWHDLDQPYSLYFRRLFPVADVIAALLALALVLTLLNVSEIPSLAGFLAMRVTVKNICLLTVFVVFWIALSYGLRMMVEGEAVSFREDRRRVATMAALGSIPALMFPLTSVSRAFGWTEFVAFSAVVVATLLGMHGLLRLLGNVVGPRLAPVRHCLIVGSGPRAESLLRALSLTTDGIYEVIGFVDHTGAHTHPAVFRYGLLGEIVELGDILKARAVDEVLIALPMKSCYSEIQSTVTTCEKVGVACRIPSDLFTYSIGRPSLMSQGAMASIALRMVRHDGTVFLKRLIDIVGALVGLIVFSPLLLAAAIAVRVTSPGPILFRQQRYGHNRRLFTMYKFRSMWSDAEQRQHELEARNEMGGPVFKIAQDPRVTPVGRWLRRTSIDELPQFWNVLMGSMSLVGPRPLPVRDVSKFSEAWLMRRFSVKPGCTCLWQISGRNHVDFDRWIALDLAYIDNWSLLLDFKILLRTFSAVVRGSGAV